MIVTQVDLNKALTEINQAFELANAKISKLEAQVKELQPKPAPKKVAKSA